MFEGQTLSELYLIKMQDQAKIANVSDRGQKGWYTRLLEQSIHLEFHSKRCNIVINCWLLLCIDILDGLVNIRNTTNIAIKCVKQKSGLFKICHRKQPK